MAGLTLTVSEPRGQTAGSPLSLHQGLPVVSGPHWPGLAMFTTTRLAGRNGALPALDLADQTDRRRLEDTLPGPVSWLAQVHGTQVVNEADIQTAGATAILPQADALIT